jgi:hypothetical protein
VKNRRVVLLVAAGEVTVVRLDAGQELRRGGVLDDVRVPEVAEDLDGRFDRICERVGEAEGPTGEEVGGVERVAERLQDGLPVRGHGQQDVDRAVLAEEAAEDPRQSASQLRNQRGAVAAAQDVGREQTRGNGIRERDGVGPRREVGEGVVLPRRVDLDRDEPAGGDVDVGGDRP